MAEIDFRAVKRSDLKEVIVLLNQLKEIDVSKINLNKAWSDFISNSSSNSIVGIYNNKVVAYGSLVVENKIRGEVAGHIEDIVVDSNVRGKMIGVALIKELIKIGKIKGCYRITLFCKETLVKFYSRNGFEVNNVVMKKYL
ncbi:MAG: GNAT family N-acetyltransferase [Flavobacteriaceae bacterium]|nr:GNAT family N-acetyltransferase [Flavobacteriaceae bacterium]|tara:strand:- start:588 stop:1010 length:423 start_codon:yes stop_codon:yes gene_type:complete